MEKDFCKLCIKSTGLFVHKYLHFYWIFLYVTNCNQECAYVLVRKKYVSHIWSNYQHEFMHAILNPLTSTIDSINYFTIYLLFVMEVSPSWFTLNVKMYRVIKN